MLSFVLTQDWKGESFFPDLSLSHFLPLPAPLLGVKSKFIWLSEKTVQIIWKKKSQQSPGEDEEQEVTFKLGME